MNLSKKFFLERTRIFNIFDYFVQWKHLELTLNNSCTHSFINAKQISIAFILFGFFLSFMFCIKYIDSQQ